jgi:hypothetical protein
MPGISPLENISSLKGLKAGLIIAKKLVFNVN